MGDGCKIVRTKTMRKLTLLGPKSTSDVAYQKNVVYPCKSVLVSPLASAWRSDKFQSARFFGNLRTVFHR